MSEKLPFYVTTPIYYVNDSPHIGHAYTSLSADMVARFMRMDGRPVRFLTGTDEHGQKIQKAAEAKGMDPQSFTDDVSERFRHLSEVMGYSEDDFIRTTESRHKKAAQAIWERLLENGHIYLGSYAGWYAVRDEAFYAESEIVDGKGPTGAPVEWVEEPSYFFDLSKWQDKLLAFYEENPDFIVPKSRYNEVVSFVKGGLKDLSVSRTSFEWGVKVPGDDQHIMYVWLDALTNYISALGFPDEGASLYKEFWPATMHIVGKDILRFHAVYWPAFLMAAGLEPPKRIVAHGWWTNEGQKISKSIGNVIDPKELVSSFGLDQTRYFLMREVPFGNDGNFSRQAMVNRINGELANSIGNLVQRTLSMVHKHCDGLVPASEGEFSVDTAEGYHSIALLAEGMQVLTTVREAMNQPQFSTALEAVMALAASANGFIDREAPWSLRKTDEARMRSVLYVLMESIRQIGLLLRPCMPDTMDRLLSMLGVDEADRVYKACGFEGRLKAGTPIGELQILFPRCEEEVISHAG